MAKEKPNLFESIGGALGGVGQAVGGLVRGTKEALDIPPKLPRAELAQQEQQLLIINNAAGMLSDAPEGQQETILAAFKRIGLNDESIAAAQQVAAAGQPLNLDEMQKLLGETPSTIDIGPAGRVTGARTVAGKKTPAGTIPRPTVQSRRFDEAISDIQKDISLAQKDTDVERGNKRVAELVPRLKQARLERDRFLASQTGLVEQAATETVPAVTRDPTFLESILPGGVKRGSTVTVAPETTRTTVRFGTPATAPSIRTEAPQSVGEGRGVKTKSKSLKKRAKKGLKGMEALKEAFRNKEITATEFKNLQVKLRNKSVTMEQVLAKLEQIRKGG